MAPTKKITKEKEGKKKVAKKGKPRTMRANVYIKRIVQKLSDEVETDPEATPYSITQTALDAVNAYATEMVDELTQIAAATARRNGMRTIKVRSVIAAMRMRFDDEEIRTEMLKRGQQAYDTYRAYKGRSSPPSEPSSSKATSSSD
jgi:histone H3/H4